MTSASALRQIPPLFFYTAAFIAGISWHQDLLAIKIYAITIIVLALTLYKLQADRLKTIKLVPGICCTFLFGALRTCAIEYNMQIAQQRICDRPLTIMGIITNQNQERSQCSIQLIGTMNDQGRAHSESSCTIQIQSKDNKATIGDYVVLPHIYLHCATKNHLKKQGIFAQGRCKEISIIIKKQQSCCILEKISSWIDLKCNKILASIKQQCSPKTYTLLASLFFGYQATDHELREQFQWWGISHYLARSGLHLVIFAMVLQWLMMLLPCSLTIKRFLIFFCISVYALFSWATVSFVRSIIMIYLLIFCYQMHIQAHTIHNISLACFLILLYNPTYLTTLDFQLSFALTLALALLHDATIFRKANLSANLDCNNSINV